MQMQAQELIREGEALITGAQREGRKAFTPAERHRFEAIRRGLDGIIAKLREGGDDGGQEAAGVSLRRRALELLSF